MKFEKIVCVDYTKLEPWAMEELQELSEEKIEVHNNVPDSNEELLQRIGDADAVLVSWKTKIPEVVIRQSPNLKYIGMACSLYDDESANVAVNFARSKGVRVTGIKDYGDPGVAEFIVSELIRLFHGLGKQQWQEMPVELTGKKIGIIGFGVTGQLLAKCLKPFGPKLFYYSRTRKKDLENGISYLPLQDLLQTVDVISFHLPRNTLLLSSAEFDIFGTGKILINTSLGLPFEESAFQDWIKKEGNFAIFDGDGKKELSAETENLPRVITADKSAGWAAETQKRLSEKVLQNVKDFLK
ncbi:dihydrofolate reductase [Salinimicrobium sp. MT39]|uniref:Dihydrofolate reductase n=1 Tax=Salinimicrobium profundisediminis TaxID=2994553 RepID=A0A9X3I1M3_9FLAO|nr:NAD(P)-dependent oxidoreductase [Salinimicrobium profundisediminis]MCX2839225.1 dihydrofolate reductase [Salinimicrobium profundisediminis]